jgi:ankyrin repeat protein
VDRGAKVHVVDRDQRTPLQLAEEFGNADLVGFLNSRS